MQELIDLKDFDDNFVIHYGGQLHQVNVNTFVNSLICLANIIDEINIELNTNQKIEIKIEALAQGSFRPKIKLVSTSIKNLFDNVIMHKYTQPTAAIISALTALLLMKQSPSITNNIIIKNDDVIIQKNGRTIILPKQLYEESNRIYNNNPKIQNNLSKTFDILQDDVSVTDFGITKNIDDKKYMFYATAQDFPKLATKESINEEENTKTIIKENETVQVIKAILEKSNRRWEFVWNGAKIPATINDDDFFKRLVSRQEVFRHGDYLIVDLKIHQIYDPIAQVFLNKSFEVIKVKSHPANEIAQTSLDIQP